MTTRNRLRRQWTESAQDWIAQDQTIRTDFLDYWVLKSLGDVSNKRVIDIGCGEGTLHPPARRTRRRRHRHRPNPALHRPRPRPSRPQ